MNTKTQNTKTSVSTEIFNYIYLLSFPVAIALYFINL